VTATGTSQITANLQGIHNFQPRRLQVTPEEPHPGDGYRSQVDAVVWATLSAVIAVFPSSGSQLERVADYRFDGIACKESAST
jgi:hypothetical protein